MVDIIKFDEENIRFNEYKKDLEKQNDETIVVHSSQIEVIYTYPLLEKTTIKYKSTRNDRQGFTKRDIGELIVTEYKKMFEEQKNDPNNMSRFVDLVLEYAIIDHEEDTKWINVKPYVVDLS